MSYIRRGVSIWLANLPLFTLFLLGLWLPCNFVRNMVTRILMPLCGGNQFAEALVASIPLIAYGVVSPLSAAAVIYSVHRIANEREVSFGAAMNYAFGSWTRLFCTQFVATLLTLVGFVCLIVPGFILMLRYSFINHAFVLEGHEFGGARERSARLAQLVRLPLIGLGIMYVGFAAVSSTIFYALMEIVPIAQSIPEGVADVCFDSLIDMIGMPFMAAVYFLYTKAAGDSLASAVRSVENDPNEFLPTATDEPIPRADEDNPYQPPMSV